MYAETTFLQWHAQELSLSYLLIGDLIKINYWLRVRVTTRDSKRWVKSSNAHPYQNTMPTLLLPKTRWRGQWCLQKSQHPQEIRARSTGYLGQANKRLVHKHLLKIRKIRSGNHVQLTTDYMKSSSEVKVSSSETQHEDSHSSTQTRLALQLTQINNDFF